MLAPRGAPARLFVLAVALGVLAVGALPAPAHATKQGERAPDFTLPRLDGTTRALSSLRAAKSGKMPRSRLRRPGPLASFQK